MLLTLERHFAPPEQWCTLDQNTRHDIHWLIHSLTDDLALINFQVSASYFHILLKWVETWRPGAMFVVLFLKSCAQFGGNTGVKRWFKMVGEKNVPTQ